MAKLDFSFDTGTIPVSRIVEDFAVYYNYQDTILDPADTTVARIKRIPNPESKVQFARRMVGEHIRTVVKAAEAQTAAKTAGDAADLVRLT